MSEEKQSYLVSVHFLLSSTSGLPPLPTELDRATMQQSVGHLLGLLTVVLGNLNDENFYLHDVEIEVAKADDKHGAVA